MKEGLKQSLNAIREMSVEDNKVYHQYVPVIDDNTSITALADPVLTVPVVANEFMSMLINRIVYTQFENKYFRNPLQILEGDRIPLGYAGQEIYVNPAKARQYNVNDFAGLLQKYEADVKVQYMTVNMDLQYPVTVGRHELKKAFTSWDSLDSFIDQLSNSLYNGAYIDEYMYTKYLVTGAYLNGGVKVEVVNGINSEETAKSFVKKARTIFLNMETPTSNFNAWKQVGGYGRDIITWSNPEDIVFLLRNDVRSELDIDVLASAFNIDKATLLGNILPINDFNVYDDNGELKFDGSNIIGMIADKSWFRIKRQDMYLDEFYNANNRTWQYYLNLTKMYQYSLFANAIVFATQAPQITISELDYKANVVDVVATQTEGLEVSVKPFSATEPTIVYTSSNTDVFTVQADPSNNRIAKVLGVAKGTAILTATAGNISTTTTINVKEA